MEITYLSSRGYSNNNGTSVLAQPTGTGISYLASRGKTEEEEKNVGGLLGGIGYLGEKVAVGTVSSLEGISDYTFSGLAKLFGNDAWAEEIIANDWFGDWYSHPEEWFNPGKGWQVAGDVAGGIGTSIPAMAATVGAAIATGGASALVQAGAGFGASFLTSGLGAAGRATKEAYDQTGKLTGKEFGYGALSGATEGGLEGLTNLIGVGTGAVVKSLTKSLAKETGEALMKNAVVEGIKSFAGEAFEEGVSEWLTPYWQRATYDPKAQNATADEIMYSAVVGGLSGLVMDGGKFAFDKGATYTSGVKAAKNNTEAQILSDASDIIAFENKNQTGSELFSEITRISNKLSESLKATGGKAVRADQQMELGALKRATVAASGEIGVAKRAMNIINNADTIAERLTAYGYKKADGTPITYTADQLTAGYDKTRPQSIFKALKTNDTLRSLAVADFTGRLMMDTAQFKQKTLTGERLASQSDLNRFVQQANPEEVAAVSKALNIDSWSGLTAEAFNQKIIDFVNDGGVERTLKATEQKKQLASIPVEEAQGVPKLVNLLKDGTRRYTDGKLDIGVELKGDKYTIYDYNNDTLSRGMSKDEVNSVLRDYAKKNSELEIRNSKLDEATTAAPTVTPESQKYNKLVEDIKKFQNETREIDSFAREHVKEYAKLSQPTKDMIQNVIREGRANGLSDSDVTMLARVSAHSGIDIQFDKEATYRGTKEDGTADYADGFYEASKNRIVINPEGKRTAEKLLIHELDHAIRKSFDADGKPATKIYLEAIEGVDQATRDKILKAYKKTATPGDVAATVMDETNAYYAEQVLGNKYTMEKLLEAEPTLKDKILSFFKGASTDYADVPKLSSAAKRYYKTYKKLFDEFSARNYESNAIEKPLTSMNSENMQVSGRNYASKSDLYSYDTLIKKKDLPVITLPTTIPQTADGKLDKKTIIAQARSNARKQNNPNNTDTNTYVHVDDIGVDVLLGAKGLQHGLARSEETAFAVMKIGDILKESIAINEMNGSTERNTDMSYVLLGACQDGTNLYVVRSVVSKLKNDVTEIDIYQLGAVKGKKTKTPNSALKRGAAVTEQGSLISSGSSIVSIADLIQYVKDIPLINEVFSEDVAKEIGVTRSVGTLTNDLRYALDLNENNKKAQFDIIQETNPMWDEYHTGIRSVEDIRTWDEVLKLDDEREGQFVWGDFSRSDAEQALKNGKVTVYSSYPIKNGVFVSTSHVQAEQYAGGRGGKVYSKIVPLDKVAWINGDEGQYADVKTSSGKQYALDIDSDSENISGAEVMSWLNNKPKNDGKLDLEATVARGLPYKRGKSDLTVGELRKVIANTTHEKVYSKSDALKAVNKLSGTWGLTVKARDEIADTVWQFLNEAPDIEYRQDMAHDIAEYIVAKVLMDSKTENPDALEAAERLSYLRTGIGKLSFSDADIAELRHAVDDKGLKRLMGRWGFKGTKKSEGTSGGYVASRRIPIDVYVTNVAREMPGMEHLEEMHPAEALLEIDKAYSRAYADSKDKWISTFWDMPDSEIPSMIKDVEDGIMSAFDVFGEKSKFKKQVEAKIESYQKRAEKFKAERDEIKGRDRVLGLLMNQATKMKNLKMGTYANATQHDSDVLRGSVERLSAIQFRGNLNVSGTRNIISELRLWYNPKNSMLEYVDEQNPGYYSKGISDMLDALADGEGGFTKEDLITLYDVMAYFTNFVENYGKVWRKGQWVDADVEAKRYVNTLQTNGQLPVSAMRRLLGSRYMQTFGDPMTVARRMDMYESGFFTEMLEELREGAMGAQVAEMEILGNYDKFLTENRKYIEQTATERIIYQGVEVPKMHLIGLYMTLKRKHSRPGLAQNGFAFYDTDGKKVRVNGFALDKDITEAEINKRSEEQLSLIASKLTEKDMEYIKILEKAYNEDARRLKAERDIQRLGFTNAGMGYYYPIRRGNIAKNVDSSKYMAELDRVSNSSFNKNTVKGARQELYIENADVVFRRHVRAVTQYSYLSPAIEAYNRLYNLDVGGNPNQPISVATESANTWDKGNAYFKKLIADIQGIPPVSGEGTEILSKMRSGYAKYQLGANPKVWFTQLSSLFASTSMLDADSIARGASISAEGIDEYCPLAKLRNSENTAAIAQAVLDTRGKRAASNIDRFSDLLMVPIGKMDRFVVGRLFAASQAQVEKDGGAKVGTEENKIAAGKLLTEVILETQQNSIATERSAGMRSGNEIIKTATMFSADSMKVTGRVLDSFGEILTLKAKIKAESDADKVKVLTDRLNKTNKQLGKSMGAMVGSSVYMACVAQLFRHIYNKDKDEDKSTAEIMAVDVIGNMLGGLPVVNDIISRLFLGGYELDNPTYSMVNDLLDSASSLANVAGDIFNGEAGAEEKNRAIRNLINSLGQFTGLPTRNAYNVIFGLTKRFSPTAAFAVDSLFYKKNYQTELNKAIERGDSKMASYIFGLMLGERLDESMDQSVFNELLALTKAGYKVVPKSMPDTITIGGVEYLVSDGERAAMQKTYSGYDNAVSKLISSKAYGSFTDEEKALAIDYVSDLYYSKAKAEVLGTDEKKAAKLIDAIGAEVLASYYIKTKGISSDVDAQGNTISGSKRAKVVSAINGLGVNVEQRLLLICASGYSLKDGDIRGVTAEAAKVRLLKYILRMKGLTADERAEIAEMCGFEVKNGKIVNNFSKNLKKISSK